MSDQELRAGADTDALVASRVMGLAKWCECGTGLTEDNAVCGQCGLGWLPPYSEDIAAAWQVVDRLRSRGWWWQISSKHGESGPWLFEVWTDHRSDPDGTRVICWEAPSVPLAICRAALGAVEKLE